MKREITNNVTWGCPLRTLPTFFDEKNNIENLRFENKYFIKTTDL
jgi:hypothetical protein